jgi:hypothetical protein
MADKCPMGRRVSVVGPLMRIDARSIGRMNPLRLFDVRARTTATEHCEPAAGQGLGAGGRHVFIAPSGRSAAWSS